MDRNTVTGLILIFIIMMGWAYFTMPDQEQLQRQRIEQARQDSLANVQATLDDELPDSAEAVSEQEGTISDSTPVSGSFGQTGVVDTLTTIVETPLYRATYTNIGAGPSSYRLKEHETWDHEQIQLISDTTRSAYSLGFLSNENYNVETRNLLFEQVHGENRVQLGEGEEGTLRYRLPLQSGGEIIYTWTFHADRYEIDLDIAFEGTNDLIIGNRVDFGWHPPLPFTERDIVQDATFAKAYVYAGGVLEELKVSDEGEEEMTINGTINWVSSKTKFFAQIIKPQSETHSALLQGRLSGPADQPATIHHYQTSIQSSIADQGELSYMLYLGPLDYYDVRRFDDDAFDMVEISYSWMRWFADPLVKWVIIPYFDIASNWIGNYGLLIILFGVLVKLLLAPLTKKSFTSMAAMKELQPKMKELQEAHKDNPKKQQEETLKLYKKAKVNPLGGCLPMLLQFPILITLWRFFQNAIQIRQEAFLWAPDLSAPDYILSLPFSIPFLGDEIAGFVLLMSASMVVQMKVSGGMGGGSAPAGGPNMKAFQYIMPVMLLFIFNSFAAGLSLYYLVYNVLSILQQQMINKQMDHSDLLERIESDEKQEKRKRRRKRR
ncbi:MAG: membrane protein insertase YidC [Balneolaceae bacterium]